MDHPELVHLVNTDPVARTLLAAAIPMRIAYVGLDGHPRSVPVAYLWNGEAFVFASPPTAYKVKAIAAHPEVAFTVDTASDDARARVAAELGPPVGDYTPLIMLGRGRASVQIRDGLPQEHVDASRRMVPAAEMAEWERAKRAATSAMAVISVAPTHLTLCDFITRFPPPHAVGPAAYQTSPAR